MKIHVARTQPRAGWSPHALAVLRIGLGVEFLLWAGAKISTGWLSSGRELAQVLADSTQAPAPYARFLTDLVLPHVDLFARLVTIGEATAGLSLLLGLGTPLGALTGMWLMLNFMLMRGVVGVDASIDRVFFIACLTCLLSAAGRVWGLDSRLHVRAWPEREASLWSARIDERGGVIPRRDDATAEAASRTIG